MSVHVTVAVDESGLVAVKRATTDAEVERLRAEALRLRRAGHPGVVALVGHDRVAGGEELRLRYAGDPLTRWRGSLAQVAGLGAAVAATLADLHGLGLVHGRVDAGHVLVGADGRPRLCGFSDPGEATPADDVLALGRLVATLADEADEGRRSAFAFARAGGGAGERRALGRLLTRALDPEPGRRPSARALSTGILAAVPAAALPPSSGEHPAVGDGLPPATPERAGPAPAGAVGTAEAEPPGPAAPAAVATSPDVWHDVSGPAADSDIDSDTRTDPEPDADAAHAHTDDDADAGDRGDHEEADDGWTHFGAGADDDRAAGHRPPAAGAEPERRDARAGRASALAAASSAGGDGRDAPAHPTTSDAGATEADEAGALDAWLAWSASAGLDRPLPRPAPRPGDGGPNPARAPGRRATGPVPLPRLGDLPRPGRTPPPEGGGADDGDTLSWVPRRIREQVDGTAATRARRRGRAGAAAALAALALGAGALTAGQDGGGSPPTGPGRAACPASEAPAADVDGDGCPERLAVDGNRVSAGDATWEVGEPGDVVAVGDWDCDGAATSAVLRPATGDVFLFGGWTPDADPVTVTPARSVPGGVALRVDPGKDGCDALVVEAADGAATVVAEARA